MAGNSFGQLFRITTFGESHGNTIGGVIDGCPAGLYVDLDFIQNELDRRKPGRSFVASQRKEEDIVRFLSGIFEGKTTGTPIGFTILNKDHQSSDYSVIKEFYRPSHADFTYDQKYGIRDYRGGGRASARETIARVVGGAIAKLLLRNGNIHINACTTQIGKVKLDWNIKEIDPEKSRLSLVGCPDETVSRNMVNHLEKLRKNGDTTGGIITCIVKCPLAGFGEPVFDKLEADLAKSMMSINAVKGFEIGSGFQSAGMKGSEHNDPFIIQDEKIVTSSNYSGGIQGGISNGQDIYFNVAFKPVATIMKPQKLMSKSGKEKTMKGTGRHDVCVVPRAIPIVEAMAAMVLADHYLRSKINKL